MEKKTLHESEYLEKLTEYIRENKSNSEIAEIFGVSKTTVAYWVRKKRTHRTATSEQNR